jgi:hypothetical protein
MRAPPSSARAPITIIFCAGAGGVGVPADATRPLSVAMGRRVTHSDAAQYIPLVILYTKYTKRRLNDSTARGYLDEVKRREGVRGLRTRCTAGGGRGEEQQQRRGGPPPARAGHASLIAVPASSSLLSGSHRRSRSLIAADCLRCAAAVLAPSHVAQSETCPELGDLPPRAWVFPAPPAAAISGTKGDVN